MLSIPRGVTISVTCHTVAYDYATITQLTTRPLPPYTYESRFKGVYAASIAIRGQDGKFLTPKEFRVLIGGAKEYLAAATQYINDGEQWLPGPLTGSYRRLIRSVDFDIQRRRPQRRTPMGPDSYGPWQRRRPHCHAGTLLEGGRAPGRRAHQAIPAHGGLYVASNGQEMQAISRRRQSL